jgi:ankyrin repeat protein
MKSLKIAFAACALALACAPAAAQMGGTDSQAFIDAVQKRDAAKAIGLIASHPTIVDTRADNGDTGLIIALRAGDEEWAGFFLKKGADPNLPGEKGDTPLIAAAKASFDQAAEWLIALGARVDGTNKAGETPLIIAVQRRDERLVRLLLNNGADPDHTDSVAGYSARDYATRDQRARAILKLIEQKKPKAAAISAR